MATRKAKQQARAETAEAVEAGLDFTTAKPAAKIIGLCSFYDEEPKLLAAMLASGSKLPVDHWVILDGAYGVYPGGQASSRIEQHEMIARTCDGLGIGWTIHVPATTWRGNEVEKRDRLFAYGQLASEPGDWFVIMDADQTFRLARPDLRERLLQSENDAAIVQFWNFEPPDNKQMREFNWEPVSKQPIPIFFRAQADPIRVVGNHYTYETTDHRLLWGHGIDKERVLAFTDLQDVVKVNHRSHDRPRTRLRDKSAYYKRRDRSGIEFVTCLNCSAKGIHKTHAQVAINQDGNVEAWEVVACDEHFEEIERRKQADMKRLGIRPGYFTDNAPVGVSRR